MTNFDDTNLDKCIFLGEAGAGKTSIINMLTKHKFKSNEITDQIVIYETKRFYIFDTPGFKSRYNRISNDIHIHDLKGIFLVIKYETRFESILNKYYELTSAIPEEYEKKIVIIISHFDLSSNHQEDVQMIFKTLYEVGASVMTCSKYFNAEDVANCMHLCMFHISKDNFHLNSSFFSKDI